MNAIRRPVTKVVRKDTSFARPGLDDFELGPPEDVSVDDVARRTDLAPWGLDEDGRNVVLLDVADARRLRDAMFVYQEQAAQATSVVLVPYEAFVAAFAPPSAAPARPPVFLHSVGRCGSTLLSQRLAAIPGVCSLSEPGPYSAIQAAVEEGRVTPSLAAGLLRATTALLSSAVAGDDVLVVKTRGEDCRIWPVFDAAHPDARSLFLYRDAAAVVQSYDRILGYPHGRTQALPERDVVFERQLPAYEHALRTRFFARRSPAFDVARREAGPWAGLLLAEWLDKVAAYLDARERDPERVFALRYEDFVDRPDDAIADVARFLDLRWTGDVVPMDGDSQAGTLLEGVETLEHPIDMPTYAALERAGRAVLGDGYDRLPGTWSAPAR